MWGQESTRRFLTIVYKYSENVLSLSFSVEIKKNPFIFEDIFLSLFSVVLCHSFAILTFLCSTCVPRCHLSCIHLPMSWARCPALCLLRVRTPKSQWNFQDVGELAFQELSIWWCLLSPCSVHVSSHLHKDSNRGFSHFCCPTVNALQKDPLHAWSDSRFWTVAIFSTLFWHLLWWWQWRWRRGWWWSWWRGWWRCPSVPPPPPQWVWHYLGLSPGCSLRLTWGDFHCITCSLFVIGGFLLLTIITIALFSHCNFLSLSFIFLNIAHLKSIWLKYRKTNTQNTNTKDAMSALPEELANQPLHLKSSPRLPTRLSPVSRFWYHTWKHIYTRVYFHKTLLNTIKHRNTNTDMKSCASKGGYQNF